MLPRCRPTLVCDAESNSGRRRRPTAEGGALVATGERVGDPDTPNRDRFGVSLRLLGNHEEDFYAAVGRFVLLTSVLEDRLHVLHDRFGCRHDAGGDSLYAVITACGQHLEDVTDQRDRDELRLLLTQCEQARLVRNQLAHYLFPAQEDGTVFGWSEHRGMVKTTDSPLPGAAATSGEGRMSVQRWARRVDELSTTVEAVDRAIWRLPAPCSGNRVSKPALSLCAGCGSGLTWAGCRGEERTLNPVRDGRDRVSRLARSVPKVRARGCDGALTLLMWAPSVGEDR